MSMQIENLNNYELAIRQRNEISHMLQATILERDAALFAARQHLQTVETQARIIAGQAAQAPIQSAELAEPFAYFIKLNGRLVECHADEPKAFAAYTAPTAQQQASTVPAGWKLVPCEPAPDSVDAALAVDVEGEDDTLEAYRILYRAMVDYAPQPPVAPAHALTDAARDVLAERQRQIGVEGWTPKHDDQYVNDELSLAAACYAITAETCLQNKPSPQMWPWPENWWKPTTDRRNLIKAGALILAEIERLDRAAHLTRKGAL